MLVVRPPGSQNFDRLLPRRVVGFRLGDLRRRHWVLTSEYHQPIAYPLRPHREPAQGRAVGFDLLPPVTPDGQRGLEQLRPLLGDVSKEVAGEFAQLWIFDFSIQLDHEVAPDQVLSESVSVAGAAYEHSW